MTHFRLLLSAALLTTLAASADAQRYARRGVVMRAPYGGMMVSPYRGFSVRTPGFSYGVSPGFVSPRGYTARYGWPGVSVRVEGSVVTPSLSSESAGPTPAAYLDEAPAYEPAAPPQEDNLLAQLEGALAALDARLDQFNGGDGWRRYLTPEGGSAADAPYRAKLLRRMDSVAADPQFQAVSQLAEFQQAHELLQAMAAGAANGAARPALPAAPIDAGSDASAAEPIPVPNAQPASVNKPASNKPANPGGERSVLAN